MKEERGGDVTFQEGKSASSDDERELPGHRNMLHLCS